MFLINPGASIVYRSTFFCRKNYKGNDYGFKTLEDVTYFRLNNEGAILSTVKSCFIKTEALEAFFKETLSRILNNFLQLQKKLNI